MLQCKTLDQRPSMPAATGRGRAVRLGAWMAATVLATSAGGAPGGDTPQPPPALMPSGAPALAMQAMSTPARPPEASACVPLGETRVAEGAPVNTPDTWTGPHRLPTPQGDTMFSANKLAAS